MYWDILCWTFSQIGFLEMWLALLLLVILNVFSTWTGVSSVKQGRCGVSQPRWHFLSMSLEMSVSVLTGGYIHLDGLQWEILPSSRDFLEWSHVGLHILCRPHILNVCTLRCSDLLWIVIWIYEGLYSHSSERFADWYMFRSSLFPKILAFP